MNNNLYGIFYFELPEPMVNFSYFLFSESLPEHIKLFFNKISCDHYKVVLDDKLQKQFLIPFLTLNDFLSFFDSKDSVIQNALLGPLQYEMSFSTLISELCTVLENANITICVVDYWFSKKIDPNCNLYHSGYLWKSENFHPPALRSSNEQEVFQHYALLDINPKYIQNRALFSDYEFSLITQGSVYSTHSENDCNGQLLSWFVKLMEFKFYYIYGYLELSGNLSEDATNIYKFLGQIVRHEFVGVEMCGSFWNRSDRKLYFWLACEGQNYIALVPLIKKYSRIHPWNSMNLNFTFFFSISNSEWDFRTFVNKYMSYPKGGVEKAPLNLHYYMLCNPNNYTLLRVFGNIYLPTHYIDLLVKDGNCEYEKEYDWLKKDAQGNLSALDYFVFNVLFDDREFDKLGYGLGLQLSLWLLMPSRVFRKGKY